MTIKITRKMRDDQQRLTVELPLIKDRLGRAGLYKTMQAMDAAVKQIGYEIAEQLSEKQKP